MHDVTTLPGGLRVASEHMPGVRSVSVGYWIDAGARDERPDQRGLAHFIEHMLFKGGARPRRDGDRGAVRRARRRAERGDRRRTRPCCTPASSTTTCRSRST